MTIKKIFSDLETAGHPVAKVLHKGKDFRVLAIGFLKGMILKEHQAHLPSKLTVLTGKVVYKQEGIQEELSVYDEKDIPLNLTHSVEALSDSLCLLTQGA
jgi:quercetin dioxygenase-like cupin family protein